MLLGTGEAGVVGEVAAVLGAQTEVEVPEDLADAVQTLLSPARDLVVGSRCYAAGTPPEGRPETDALVTAKRKDLLRNALRGLSPEGRIYGALGLRELPPVSDADRKSIEQLAEQTHRIRTCLGCSARSVIPREILDATGPAARDRGARGATAPTEQPPQP